MKSSKAARPASTQPAPAWRAPLFALTVLGGVVSWLFWPLLFGNQALFGSDALAIGLPINMAARRAMGHGQFPWWLGELYCGMPGIASTNTDFLHPVHLFLQWMRVPVPSIFGLDMALHALLSGLGMLFFARRALNLSWQSALVAALAFCLSGSQLSVIYAGHANNVKAIAMIPWAFWGLWEAARGGRWLGLGLTALALAMQIYAVGMQIGAYTGLGLGAFAFWLGWTAPARRRGMLESFGALAAAALLAGLLAAPQLLPSLDYKSVSLRQEFSYKDFTSWSFPPLEALTWWVPGLFGWGGETYWGEWDFSLSTEYFGLLPWALAAGAVVALWKDKAGPARFMVFLALGALLIALGRHFPIHYLFYKLPVFNGFRSWVRFLCLFTFAASALAGLGWEALRGSDARAGKAAQISAEVLALLALIALLAASPIAGAGAAKLASKAPQGAPQLEALRALIHASALRSLLYALGAAALVFAARGGRLERWGKALGLAALALIVADSHLVAERYLQFQDPKIWTAEPGFMSPLREELRLRPGRVVSQMSGSPNQPAISGLQLMAGYHGLPPSDASRLMKALGGDPKKLFSLCNVRFYLAPQPVNVPWLRPAGAEGGTYLYENTLAVPRARVAFQAMGVRDPGQVFDVLTSKDFDPLKLAVVEGQGYNQKGQAEVSWTQILENTQELSVSLDKPGLLVITQGWFKGWSATVDGVPAPILKANLAFQGIRLEPGRHAVRLQYREPRLSLALGLLALGLACLAFLAYKNFSSRSV